MLDTGGPKPRTILFLCRLNGARSIMAEAITNARSDGLLRAYSAGVEPLKALPPPVLATLRRHDIPTDGLHPKIWNEFTVPNAQPIDFVITTCDVDASEVCPSWPGQPRTAHWRITNPAIGADTQDIFRKNLESSFHLISRLVGMFISLPEDARDRMGLEEIYRKIA